MTEKRADQSLLMTRRDAIVRVGAMLGGVTLVGQGAMLAACSEQKPETPGRGSDAASFTQDEIALLDEIAETILPETDTPGAKAAGVGPFMAMMVTDCYDEREQQTFSDGLSEVDERCRTMHGADFMSATPAQRHALLEHLDREQFDAMRARESREQEEGEDASPAHFFRMMKELALLGYFTSEIGYTRAMRYAETPGRFDPCAPFEPGEKAWAEHA